MDETLLLIALETLSINCIVTRPDLILYPIVIIQTFCGFMITKGVEAVDMILRAWATASAHILSLSSSNALKLHFGRLPPCGRER